MNSRDFRCPTVFCDYAVVGSDAPRAAQGTGYNTSRREAFCLDAYTGRLITGPRSAFDHKTFLRYLQEVQTRFPRAERIYIALDNWPVHFQPDVLAALASSKITLVFLPTYARFSQSYRESLAQTQTGGVALASLQ